MVEPSCSVLVASFDRSCDLWNPFFKLFWKHWPDCHFPVFLSTNEKLFPDSRVMTICAGHYEWSKMLRLALTQLESEYVLLLLEDFFLTSAVSNADIEGYLTFMRETQATVLRLNPDPPPTIKLKSKPEIFALHRLAAFRVSAQPSIWNRRKLLALLVDHESGWDFELKATLRSQAQPSGYFCTRKPAFGFDHVVELGTWYWSAAKRYKKQNIGCDFTVRKVMGPFTACRKTVMRSLRRTREFLLTLPLRTPERDAFATRCPSAPDKHLRLAFLTNLIPPYHKPVLDALSARYPHLRILLSTPMEKNRPWNVDWQGLDVVVQKTITLKGNWRHPRGFSEPLAVHFPLDTLQQLRRFNPDVIIAAEMGARTLLAILFRKLQPTCRLIVWAEAAESTESGRGSARHFARKLIVRNADAFLAVGSSAVKYLARIGADESRIFKIAYTTDIARFSANGHLRSPEAVKRLLFSGQFVERKGLIPFLSVLTEWASKYPEHQIEFWLVGDGPLRTKLEVFPLPPNVKLVFRGVFQYADLPAIYSEAGVFVLPTLADTWAVVVNEALAAGLPVLGSIYAQAVEELIQNGRNGWTFRIDKRLEVLEALDRMMNTPLPELEAMRACARSTAMSLSPERVARLIDAAVCAALVSN